MTVGTQLHDARRERKLSLGDVSRQTKIQPWVLEALEADRLQELMSPIYVKGFLASYARFLRLAPEPLLAALPWPRPAEPEPAALPPPTPAPLQWSWRLPQLPALPQWSLPVPLLRRAAALAATAALIVLIAGRHPWQGRAAALHTAKAGKTLAAKPGPSKPAAAKPAAAPAAGPQLAAVAPVPDAVVVRPAASPTLTLLPTQPLELEIVAHSSTWLQVRADGKLLSQQRLQRGARERWTARKRLEVVLSKPSQVDVFLNGQSISAAAITYEGRLLITHYGIAHLSGTD